MGLGCGSVGDYQSSTRAMANLSPQILIQSPVSRGTYTTSSEPHFDVVLYQDD